jgi:glycosyltransferase involved in cell wall biosynthesis
MKSQGKLPGYIKRHLQRYRLYILLREIKRSLKKSLKEIDSLDRRGMSLKPDGPPRGNVLFSYINAPFFLEPGQPVSNAHTHYWESLQMTRTWLDLSYCVDVISWKNDSFVPYKDYSFFIDVRYNLERIAPLLNKDCVKIMHIDTAHYLFHNAAESRRLLELQQRKGITLRPRRVMEPNWAIEHADCATILGNEFTISTYRYANKPIYRVPISTAVLYPWLEGKDFEACRKHFLWFSSGGMVHKGLDLVLDVFAEMPEYYLTVCGPVQREKDFENAFYEELYQTPNIHTIGWVDITSPEFAEITNNCIGLIYPSCSEGQSGGVVTCLHAGLIPIISYESGVDVDDDFGVILKNCSVEEIKNSVRTISSLPAQELELMARKAWEFARANHTREKFAEEYRRIVTKIINTHRK